MSTTHRASKVITLVVTCLGTFMVLLDTTIIVTALPTIQSHLHTNLSDLQWAVDAFTLPFAVIILRPFFLTVPAELEAAAKIDGCTQLGAFWRVILPLVQPGLITVAAFAFLMSWGEFLFALSLNTNE